MRTVLAIASARSAARPTQNRASAARVGTDDPRSTCGSGGATITGAARAPPSTHTSFASRADGRRGSSPGSSTRPLPPAITVTPSGPATACRRTTTLALTTWPARNAGTPARTSSPRDEAERRRRSGEPLDRRGPERRERRILEHTRTVAVGEHHTALRRGQREPGHAGAAGRAGLDGVEHGVGQAAVDDVDRVEPAERAQPQAPPPNDEVGTFHEVEPERPGERRVLDVGGILDPAGQQHDARAADGGEGRQGVAQLGGEPADRRQVTGALGPEQLGRDACHDGAVEQRVADAGRRVGEVLDDAPRTVGAGDDVDGVRRQPAWRRRGADGGEPVALARRQGLRRHPAFAHGQRAGRRGRRAAPPSPACARSRRRRAASNTSPSSTSGTGSSRHGRLGDGRDGSSRRPQVVDEVTGEGRRDHTIGFRLAAAECRAIVQEPLEQLPGEHHPTRR